MADSIATLGIRIDSSQAATAAANLNQVTAAANDAEEAAGANVGAWSKVGDEFLEVAAHARAHVLALAGASEGTRAFTGILAHLPVQLLLVGAAIAAVTAIYAAGQGETTAYGKAIATTGNAAGVTVGQLAAYADQIAKTTSNTHEAAGALATLASTGAIGGQNLQQFATVALELQDKLGQSVEETAKSFTDLANDPLAATLSLGKALGYLTPQLYQQIAAYQQQGDTVHAVSLAQQAYADANEKAVTQVVGNLGYLQRAWTGIKDVTSTVVSHAAAIGRTTSAQQELNGLTSQRGSRTLGTTRPGFFGLQDTQNDAREAQLQAFVNQQNAAAKATSDATQVAKEYDAELARQPALLQAAAALTKSYYDALSQSVVRAYATQAAGIQAQDDLLEAQRSAGLLEDQDYYAAKIALIQKSGSAQETELGKEIALAKSQAAAEAAIRASQIAATTDPGSLAVLRAQDSSSSSADQQKILDLQQKRGQVATETSSKVAQANIQEGASVAALSRSYADLVGSTDAATLALQKQYALTLSGAGQGDQARAFQSQLAQFQAQAQTQSDQNLAQFRNSNGGEAAQQQYAETERIIKQSLDQRVSDYKTYYNSLQEQQSDWSNGAKDAFQNYSDQAKNVAGLTNTAFTNSFKDIEDSIVNFATTGKLSFHDLATSILSELIRVEVKILESSVLSSVFGAFGFGAAGAASATSGVGELTGSTVGFAAAGGPISGPTIVGEKGPELFVPNQSGTIIPNHQLGGGGASINQTFNFSSGTNVAQLQAAAQQIKDETLAAANNAITRGQWNPALRSARA